MRITEKTSFEMTTKKELGSSRFSSRFTVTNITPEFDDKKDKPKEKQVVESLYRIFAKYEEVQK